MPRILIVGATRGLGAALVYRYAKHDWSVYATARSSKPDTASFPPQTKWLKEVDCAKSDVGDTIARHAYLNPFDQSVNDPLDVAVITAGVFTTEDFNKRDEGGPNFDDEMRMYATSAVAPVLIVHALVHNGLLKTGSKVVLVSSEAGSVALRIEAEGNYGHHASKAALNMVGKLLSLELQDKGIVVSIVHPGFMRTQMTHGVGFDKFWDSGHAVTPDEAAVSLKEWTDELDMSKSGQFWAPRGPADIGTAENVLGKNLSTPLQLPW
ncbi:oxidoreductase [Podospora didyma]|uniref:Oxidoreductase n=1 Tax=Podospora didyma TaxID=330526 RepID=A0AAE0U7N3_9PEZI|nr:oxidoreductase [Podospora didyma]